MLVLARGYVRFFSCPPHRLLRDGIDDIPCDHCSSEHASGPGRLALGRGTTPEGEPRGFFVSGDVPTMGIGHRLPQECRVKPFCNKPFSDAFDLCGCYLIGRRNVLIGPCLCAVGLAQTVGMNDRIPGGVILGDHFFELLTFRICSINSVSDGHCPLLVSENAMALLYQTFSI